MECGEHRENRKEIGKLRIGQWQKIIERATQSLHSLHSLKATTEKAKKQETNIGTEKRIGVKAFPMHLCFDPLPFPPPNPPGPFTITRDTTTYSIFFTFAPTHFPNIYT